METTEKEFVRYEVSFIREGLSLDTLKEDYPEKYLEEMMNFPMPHIDVIKEIYANFNASLRNGERKRFVTGIVKITTMIITEELL